MKQKAIEKLCDLASTALGKYYVKGCNPAVSTVHCDIMRTIREVARGELSEREAVGRARKLQGALSRATVPQLRKGTR